MKIKNPNTMTLVFRERLNAQDYAYFNGTDYVASTTMSGHGEEFCYRVFSDYERRVQTHTLIVSEALWKETDVFFRGD